MGICFIIIIFLGTSSYVFLLSVYQIGRFLYFFIFRVVRLLTLCSPHVYFLMLVILNLNFLKLWTCSENYLLQWDQFETSETATSLDCVSNYKWILCFINNFRPYL